MEKTIQARKWHLIDADGKVLGKVAEQAAVLLRGKSRIDFTPNQDKGDYVVVINAAKAVFSGKKLEKEVRRTHSGYLGGLKEISISKYFEKYPEKVFQEAVQGMLPKNKLASRMIARLKVFKDDKHPYADKIINNQTITKIQ